MAAPDRGCWVLRTPVELQPQVLPSTVVPHPVHAWWRALRPEDGVYLWQDGAAPGIYAVGALAGPVENARAGPGGTIGVACRAVLAEPVPAGRIADRIPQLPLGRMPWATTASLHVADVYLLNDLIRERNRVSGLPEPAFLSGEWATVDEVAAVAVARSKRPVQPANLLIEMAVLGQYMPERYPAAAELLRPIVVDWYQIPPPELPRVDWSLVAPSSRRVLDLAEAIGSEVPVEWPRPVEVHLLAALLLLDDESSKAVPVVPELPAPAAELRQGLFGWLIERPEHADNLPAWRAVLKLPPERAAVVLPRIAADSPEGREVLGRTPDVRGFARTIASATLEPPLSIGLFGEWGSGKSFFMQKVRREVDDLTARTAAVAATDPTATLGYCERVAQVWFNAWQYSEGNIWASLVQHLFANLQLSEDEQAAAVKRRQAQVLAALQSHQKTRAEAEAAVDRAKRLQWDRRRKLRRRQAELADAEQEVRELAAEDVWKAVRDPEVAARLREVRQSLGLPDVASDARALRAALDETLDVLRRGWNVLTINATGEERVATRQIVIVAGLAMAITLLLAVALAALGEDALGSVVALTGQLATALGAGTAWLRRQVVRLRTAVEPLESGRAALDRQYAAALQDHRDNEARALAELEEAEAGLAQAGADLAAAEEAEASARKELEALDTGQVLADFVHDRAASNEYAKHLGIVALVRKDFRQLSELMRQERLERAARRREAAKGAAVREAPTEDARGGERLELDRIVLYIDDLDRCRSEEVVKVLEAVHLLLALDLFVVVVGVDARWVARSLKDRYPLLLGQPDGQAPAPSDASPPPLSSDRPAQPDEDGVPATAHDYLEKIFQVPYWLPAMEPDGTGRLIRDLFGSSVTFAAADVGPVRVVGEGGVVAEEADVDPRLTELRDRLGFRGEDAFDPDPVDLLVSDQELHFMDVLSPLIGRSPRTTKRFVNVYRIIKAGLTGPQAAAWLASGKHACPAHAVMLLLAIVCGAPVSAEAFLRRWREPGNGTFATMATDVRRHRTANPAHFPDVEWRRWEETCRRYGEGWEQVRQDTVREWIPRVVQYSFRGRELMLG